MCAICVSINNTAISLALVCRVDLTFYCHMHALAGGKLGLNEDIARVFALVYFLLHI